MMLNKSFTAILAVLLLAAPAYPEPVQDQVMGRVTIRNSDKLDSQAKNEIAAIASKIKKTKNNGAVKIVGDIPSAGSQEEYITKAVFIAHSVEAQIRKLLSDKYQVFVTAAKYSGDKRSGPNYVEIHLYPHQLKVDGTGFVSSKITSVKSIKETSTTPVTPAATVVPEGLLSSPVADDVRVEVTSRKERTRVETEDPVLANELVNKAKARAAQKAKRLEQDK